MNAYGAGWGAGYASDPNSYVSTDPSYDPYQGGASNYVSTDPTYNPYGYSSGGSLLSSPGLWSSVLGGIGGYAQSQADADAQRDQTKLTAQAKLALAQQQRQYKLDDRTSRQESVSKWSKYFD